MNGGTEMDVREKLVELLDNFHRDLSPFAGNEKLFVVDDNVEQAEYLIEQGVTVQEWISVDEPPKEYRDEYGELIPFLVCEEGTDYPFRAMYDGKTWGDGIFAVPVKWWMHLPAPPKEKERKDGDGNV